MTKVKENTYIIRVQEHKRRITLPHALVEKYKIESGTFVMVEDLGDGMKITPAEVIKKNLNLKEA